jgi:hypothetical protein
MFQKSKRNKTFVFLSLILLILFFFLNRKNFLIIFNNIQTIKSLNFSLLQNEKKKNDLEEVITDFENKKEFRELIVKEKLFFKDKSEKVIFYDLDD